MDPGSTTATVPHAKRVHTREMHEQVISPSAPPARARLAAGGLVAVMALGSLAMWTAVPLGVLWGAAAIAQTAVAIYLIAIAGCPLAMILCGWGLYRINGLYLSLTGRLDAEPDGESDGRQVMLLEALVIGSAIIAAITLVVWLLFFAGSPTSTPWPDELSGQQSS